MAPFSGPQPLGLCGTRKSSDGWRGLMREEQDPPKCPPINITQFLPNDLWHSQTWPPWHAKNRDITRWFRSLLDTKRTRLVSHSAEAGRACDPSTQPEALRQRVRQQQRQTGTTALQTSTLSCGCCQTRGGHCFEVGRPVAVLGQKQGGGAGSSGQPPPHTVLGSKASSSFFSFFYKESVSESCGPAVCLSSSHLLLGPRP